MSGRSEGIYFCTDFSINNVDFSKITRDMFNKL